MKPAPLDSPVIYVTPKTEIVEDGVFIWLIQGMVDVLELDNDQNYKNIKSTIAILGVEGLIK